MKDCKSKDCDYFKLYGKCTNSCIERGLKKTITNYDRIRNMSVEELAKCLADRFDCSLCPEQENRRNKLFFNIDCDGKCVEHCKQWLKSEVAE